MEKKDQSKQQTAFCFPTFSFEGSLYLTYEISFMPCTWKIISKKTITIWQQQAIFSGATIRFGGKPDEVSNRLKTCRPVPLTIPTLVRASSPPVASQVHKSAVLEEHKLAPDKVQLQVGPDLNEGGIVGLTKVARLLPGDL